MPTQEYRMILGLPLGLRRWLRALLRGKLRRNLMRYFHSLLAVLILGCASACLAQEMPEGRLMRFPDIYKDQIVFSYGADLWLTTTSGGLARRITSHPGLELFPKFSPDGKWIAFTGQYDGNFNVYVMPAAGGEPRQLTFL